MLPEKAVPFAPSPNVSVLVYSVSWLFLPHRTARNPRCTFSAICNISRLAGEIVIFDRSWYNRAGVEHVMGFCNEEQYGKFLELCPEFEKYIVDAGIILLKYWLEVGQKEQQRRFEARLSDPLRQWKLSPMDLESFRRWYEYSRARDAMLQATDSKHAPWYLIHSDDKRKARLNCLSHFLSMVPHKKTPREKVKLPKRSKKDAYDDTKFLKSRKFVPEVF